MYVQEAPSLNSFRENKWKILSPDLTSRYKHQHCTNFEGMDNGDLPIWHLKILFLGVSWKSALNCEHNDDMMVIAKFAANIVCHSLPSFFAKNDKLGAGSAKL